MQAKAIVIRVCEIVFGARGFTDDLVRDEKWSLNILFYPIHVLIWHI